MYSSGFNLIEVLLMSLWLVWLNWSGVDFFFQVLVFLMGSVCNQKNLRSTVEERLSQKN